MKTWTKYTFACDPEECDTLIEVTCDNYGFPSGVMQLTCPCGRVLQVLSVADATIPSTTTTKEETMNEAEAYKARQAEALLELIKQKDEYITRLQDEVSALTEKIGPNHQNCDYWKSENGRIGQQLINLVNNAYDNDSDASEILESVCEIIDYNPTKTIQFEGVIHFSGSIDVPRHEQDGFDLEEALSDVYVDINNGDVVIDNYDLYSVEEPY